MREFVKLKCISCPSCFLSLLDFFRVKIRYPNFISISIPQLMTKVFRLSYQLQQP